jgi:hypothetical protein
MYVHVELDEEIRRALDDVDGHPGERRSAPDFEIELPEQHRAKPGYVARAAAGRA